MFILFFAEITSIFFSSWDQYEYMLHLKKLCKKKSPKNQKKEIKNSGKIKKKEIKNSKKRKKINVILICLWKYAIYDLKEHFCKP